MMIWSLYQKAIFEFVKNGTGNAIIEAVPGAGKSSTLVEALNYIPDHLHSNTLFLAFSKKIVDDLKDKVPQGVSARTFHSFCLQVLKSKNPKLRVDTRGEKLTNIITGLVGNDPEEKETREALEQTIKLAKAYLADDVVSIEAMMAEHDIEPTRIDFTELVIQALDICAVQRQVVDWDDMIWMCSRFNLELPTYAFVMIDEAQDSNPGRIDICRRLLTTNTRMVACGDKNQVIYIFNGSCSDSMDQLRVMMNAQVFPLNVSYRCAKSIVAEAAKYFPGIEAASEAPEGTVEEVSYQKMLDEAGPGDLILSRVNAPLVPLCLSFLLKGRRCNIQGRDMTRSFIWMIKLSKANSVDGFLTWLHDWADAIYEKLEQKNKDKSHIQDRVACLEALCDGASDLAMVKRRIKELFADTDKKKPGENKITASSIHRSKGGQADRVWLILKKLKPGKSVEEDNVCYVAVSRAKYNLYLVSD